MREIKLNREIKFRGQQINTKQWVYGYLYRNKGLYVICDNIRYAEEEPILIDTVGQYTGLKDKNGVEIYEGDILKSHFTKGHWTYNDKSYYGYKNGRVEYCVDCFILYIENYKEKIYPLSAFGDRQIKDLEVIGNVYDNPELIEKEGKVNE